ncbi:MAG TPA: hypothetical protein VM582_03680 [Candidatus Thermoplasmatota archaeon]|nr:hypothetical protein [Candidatus Thermoplasmatota archaeon]
MLAYPVLLAVMYVLVRMGRNERWGAYEWLRLGALAALMGLIIAVQVAFALAGYVRRPINVASAVVSVGGAATLMGIYLWGRWQERRPPPLPPDGWDAETERTDEPSPAALVEA